MVILVPETTRLLMSTGSLSADGNGFTNTWITTILARASSTAAGTATRTYNVGTNGALFGVANNTVMTITQLMTYLNSHASSGSLTLSSANKTIVYSVYGSIESSGLIS